MQGKKDEPVELTERTFPTNIKATPEMEHLFPGFIRVPHDRENCAGCKVNRMIAEEFRAAVRKFADDTDRLFMEGNRKPGDPVPGGLLNAKGPDPEEPDPNA